VITLTSKAFFRQYGPSSVQTNVDFVYGTDLYFDYRRTVSISSGNSTYFLAFLMKNVSNPAIQINSYWKVVRSGGVNTVYAGPSSDFNNPQVTDPNPPGATTLTFDNIYDPLQPNATRTEEDLAGTYEISEVIYETGSTPPSPSVQWSFDYRWLVLRGFSPLRKRIDPVSKNNRCKLRGEWRTLPVSTSLYPGGWTPTSNISWQLDFLDTAANLLKTVTGSTAVSTRDPVAGKVANFAYDWDCKKASGKTKHGVFFPLANGAASVPTAGSTAIRQVDTRALCTRCSCKDGLLRLAIQLAAIGSQAGNMLSAVMAFSGSFTEDGPGSMGYGWKSNTGIRVYEDPDDASLIYEDETGVSMRWALSGGSYVPYHEDNYSQIVKTASNPNYTYAVTFEDQTRREFDSSGLLVRDFDRNGNETTYDRSSGSLVMSDGKGRAIYFDYGITPRADGQTQTIRVNDPVSGRLTTMSYYPSSHPVSPDRLESITDPAGETITFVYDAEGQIAEVYDARGNLMSQYLYDDLGRKIAEQSYDQTFVQYDFGDQVALFPPPFNVPIDCLRTTQFDLNVSSSDPAYLRQTHSFYDDFYNVVEQWELVDRTVTPNVINVTELQYGDSLNPFLMTRQINPNGANTWMTYNAQGNVRTMTNDHLQVTTYDWVEDIDPAPINPKHQKLLRKIHRPQVTVNGVPTTYAPTEMQYDSNGNLVKVIDAQSNEMELTRRSDGLVTDITDRRGFTTSMAYDGISANLISITTPAGPGAAPARTTNLSYDLYDNVYEVSDPLSNTIRTIFDGNDRMVEARDARGKIVYSNYVDGLLEWIEAPTNQGSGSNRRRTTFDYDFSGRVEVVNAQNGPNNTTDYESRVGYSYTGFSQLKGLARLKRPTPSTTTVASTEVTYDPLGRAVQSADFLGRLSLAAYEPFCVGHTTLSSRGVQMSSSFDTLCRLVQVETQEERHLYGYDELDRMTIARVGELYAHEPAPNRVGGHYSKSFYKHDTTYHYDSLDRVTQVTYANGDTVSYQYDAEGNVTQMTDVHGNVTGYSYYNDGRLHTVEYEGQTFTYSYDAAGRLATIDYPSGGLVASFTTTTGASGWDENGQLLSLRYLKSGVHFHRFEYTYDDSGNRITLVDTPDSGGATSWSYGYDYLNRLTSVTRGSSTTLYAYDESDNRMSLTLPSGDQWVYGYDLADQISSKSFKPFGGSAALVESYTHDDDGNMIARTQSGVTTTYDWNTFNRLRQVAVGGTLVETTSYDHEGIRRLKVDGGGSSKSFSSGAMSLCDTRPSGPVSFVQGHQLLGLEQGGNLYFFITDGLSSVRKVVNSSGVSQGEFRFDEFGVPESSTTPSADLSAHSYVGGLGQRNEGGGLYYARQRWYDSSLGRWLTADPIGFAGGLNLYAGMDNSPITRVDPEGLVPWVKVWRLIKKGSNYGTEFIGSISKNNKKAKAKLKNMLEEASCSPKRGPGWEHKGIHIQNPKEDKIKKITGGLSDNGKWVEHPNKPQQGPGVHYHAETGKWSERGSTRVHGSQRPPMWLGTLAFGFFAPRLLEMGCYTGQAGAGEWSPSPLDYASAAVIDTATWVEPTGLLDIVIPSSE
jgi:RHS repeat-associated protein